MAFVLIGVRMTLIKQVEGHTLTKTPPKKPNKHDTELVRQVAANSSMDQLILAP